MPSWYVDWNAAGRNYAAGFALLQAHGGLTVAPRMLHLLGGFSRPGAWVPKMERGLLESKLLEVAKAAPPSTPKGEALKGVASGKSVKSVKDLTPSPGGVPPETEAVDGEPAEVSALRQSAIPLHKRHSHLHALLTAAGTDGERFKIAREIMDDVIPKLDGIYDEIRVWEKTGKPPAPPPAPGKPPVEVRKKLNSLMAQRARYRKDLKTAKTPAAAGRIQEKINLRDSEIQKLKNGENHTAAGMAD